MDQYSDPNIGPDSGQIVAVNTATEAKERAELQERLERQELQARLNRQNSAQNPNFDPGAADPNVAATQNDRNSTIIGQGLTALDIPRKYTTGPLMARALGVSDKIPPSKGLMDPYPSTGEMLSQGGYLPHNPILRGALGVAGDMVGPALLAGPLSKIPRYGQALEAAVAPGQALLKLAGREGGIATARSAFKPLDAEAYRQGKSIRPSQVLVDPKGTGEFTHAWTARGVNEKIGDVAEKLHDSATDILNQATEAGAKIDPETATKYANDMFAKYSRLGEKDDSAKAIADAIKERLEGLRLDGTDPITATELKTLYSKKVPHGKWAAYADTDLGEELDKALSRGFKESVEDSADRALGKGTELRNTNEKLGSLLSTRKKEVGQVAKEDVRDLFTAVDALGVGAGMSSGVPLGKLMTLKKAHDLMKYQGIRSQVGKGLYTFGSSAYSNPVMEGIKRSAWSLLDNNEEEKKRDKE